MKKLILSLSGLLFALQLSVVANASILNLTEGKDLCDGRAVPVGAVAALSDRQVNLTTVGAGLRVYSAFKFKIYCFQMLASDPASYVKTDAGALSSLGTMETVALRMDFVYNVTLSQLTKAYTDGFNANGVSLNNASVKAIFAAATAAGPVKDGQSITIVMDLKTNTISYEDQNGKVTAIPNVEGANVGLVSIWLGKPADAGLAALKKQMLGE